jgi:hypothetical protein
MPQSFLNHTVENLKLNRWNMTNTFVPCRQKTFGASLIRADVIHAAFLRNVQPLNSSLSTRKLSLYFPVNLLLNLLKKMLNDRYEIAMAIITVCTILEQCYVAYLIKYFTPKSMNDYRYFLILLAVSL